MTGAPFECSMTHNDASAPIQKLMDRVGRWKFRTADTLRDVAQASSAIPFENSCVMQIDQVEDLGLGKLNRQAREVRQV